MTTTAEATAAPSTVCLCGKEYRIRPLIERDLGEFVLWCQDTRMALACRTARTMEDQGQAAGLINHAHDEAAAYTTTHPAVLKMMLDINGVAELMWYGVRTFEPGLTYTPPALDGEKPEQLEGSAAIRAMLLDPETLEAATRKYEQLNASPEVRVDGRPFAPRRRRRKRKRRQLRRPT